MDSTSSLSETPQLLSRPKAREAEDSVKGTLGARIGGDRGSSISTDPFAPPRTQEEIMGQAGSGLHRIGQVSLREYASPSESGGRRPFVSGNAQIDAIAKTFQALLDDSKDLTPAQKKTAMEQLKLYENVCQQIAHSRDGIKDEHGQPIPAVAEGTIKGVLNDLFTLWTSTMAKTTEAYKDKPDARKSEYDTMIKMVTGKPWLKAYLEKVGRNPANMATNLSKLVFGLYQEARGQNMNYDDFALFTRFFHYPTQGHHQEILAHLQTAPASAEKTLLLNLLSNPEIKAWMLPRPNATPSQAPLPVGTSIPRVVSASGSLPPAPVISGSAPASTVSGPATSVVSGSVPLSPVSGVLPSVVPGTAPSGPTSGIMPPSPSS